MTYTFLQLFSAQSILLPKGALGWIVWLVLIAGTAFVIWRVRDKKITWGRREWMRFALLAVLIPFSILIFTLRLPSGGALPIPDLGAPSMGPLLPLFAALPWTIALVWFGSLPAMVLAGLSGLFLALWDTRSPFTPIEFAFLASLFAFLLNQRYRTDLFAWLRQPIWAGLFLAVLYPPLYVATSFFWVSANTLASLDFALSHLVWTSVAVATPLLISATLLQVARLRWPSLVPPAEAQQPAPSERSLEARFLFTLGPIVLLAFLAMGALAWWGAGRTAEQLFSDRVGNNLEIAADSVPFVLETGQNLILQLAGDSRLADASAADASALLQNHLNEVPYFDQLTLLDTGGNSVAGIPVNDYLSLQPTADELNAVALAIQGVSLQIVSAHSLVAESTSSQLLFIAAVRNSNDQVRSVLIGRTTINSNPFAQPVVQSLQGIDDLGAQGLLIDSEGRIVMAPLAAAVLQPYNGRLGDTAFTYDDVAPDGSRLQVRYQPVPGSSWGVVARWPARLSQQLALNIALPILAVLLLLAILAYAIFRLTLRSVTGSLQGLAVEAQRIASGDLKAPLSVNGADEIGRLGAAFETMRGKLSTRVEDTQRLLALSQGLSSSLEVRSHIDPILDAALASGASVARLVFASESNGGAVGFGKGAGNEKYEGLDAQVLALTRSQQRVLLNNPARARLKLEKGTPAPQALAAFALNDQKEQLGTLWLAYGEPQSFAPESVRYLETLASQAAAAATNARHYVSAKLGQQRVEAVLMVDPTPILLTDSKQNLVFVNSEAARILALKNDLSLSAPVQMALKNKQVLALLAKAGSKPQLADVQVDGNTYSAVVSPIWTGAELIGFACILHDVTQAKQTAVARADFLGTLGHDLRDPLELTRGYLSMLAVAGELNQQQSSYVQKIEQSIENISRMASNLLGAERLEIRGGLKVEAFAVRDLLKDVIDEIAPRARQKKVDILLMPAPPSAATLQADRTLLHRVFYNLLDNAIKFSPRGQVVEIGYKFDEKSVAVSVKDMGAGIAPVDLPGLFESGEKATGLAIVRSIVERHKGSVWVESELGAGSVFYCQIPLKQQAPAE
jgi:signal transduction histidine kinase